MEGLTIREVKSMQDVEGIEEVQRQAWNMADIGIVPNFETRAVADAGFVFIAIMDDKVVGFIYGYHHFPDVHYSHMMAVLPDYQGMDIGYQLKQYHRQRAIDSEYPVNFIQWTVDPLLPNNAYLNFAKLGGYCDTYKVNYYGDPSSDGVEIYAGVPTDRFKLTWSIKSERVKRRMDNYKQDRISIDQLVDRAPCLNSIKDHQFQGSTTPQGSHFSVEVPADYQYIRRNKLPIAIDWRMKFREICLQALDDDIIVYDYHSIVDRNSRRNFYEFVRRDQVSDL